MAYNAITLLIFILVLRQMKSLKKKKEMEVEDNQYYM